MTHDMDILKTNKAQIEYQRLAKLNLWGKKMLLRNYQSSDCEKLAALFYQTVHCVNARDYMEEQLNAWATGQIDLKQWDKSFLNHPTVIAIQDDQTVGFGDMDDSPGRVSYR